MKRRGVTIVELAVAGAILCALLAVSVEMLTAVAGQRRWADRRQCAALELANAMERIAARPWGELTSEALAGEGLSPSARKLLPEAELKIEITTAGDRPDAKRIVLSVHWQDDASRLLPPLVLTTWRYHFAKDDSGTPGEVVAKPQAAAKLPRDAVAGRFLQSSTDNP